jgi:hypothetical protein
MDISREELDKLLNFIGCGNLCAPIWFLGMFATTLCIIDELDRRTSPGLCPRLWVRVSWVLSAGVQILPVAAA